MGIQEAERSICNKLARGKFLSGVYVGMSDRNRLLDVASRIALIALIIFALIVQFGELGRPLRSGYQGDDRAQAEQREEQVLLRCARLDAPEESEAARHCERRRQYADLFAQRGMAQWAENQARLTVFSLAGLGITIALAWAAWRAADASNRQAREFFVEERRAWLAVTINIKKWSLMGDPARIIFQGDVTVENVGQTPATHVKIQSYGTTFRFYGREERDSFAAMLGEFKQRSHELTDTVFPGKELTIEAIFIADPTDNNLSYGSAFALAGVGYRYAGSDKYHITPAVQLIHYFTDTDPFGPGPHGLFQLSYPSGLSPD
jgi:hypothetical protein